MVLKKKEREREGADIISGGLCIKQRKVKLDFYIWSRWFHCVKFPRDHLSISGCGWGFGICNEREASELGVMWLFCGFTETGV